jgi:hypothetical protein
MQDSEELLDMIISPEINSDVYVIEEFLKGSLYLDFKNEILVRSLQVKNRMGVDSFEDFLIDKGGMAMLDLVLNIFEEMLANKIQDLENGENSDEKII